MLHLLEPTPRTWVQAAEEDLPGLLADHAHCELKAAQSALSLIARFGEEAPILIEPMTALAREESAHFAQVHERLDQLNSGIGRPRADEYVGSLRKMARMDHAEAPALLDRLLVCALIEARSCERFKILSEDMKSEDYRRFYGGLMASEARHFRLFCELAEQLFGTTETRDRLKALAKREATIAADLPLGPQIHG